MTTAALGLIGVSEEETLALFRALAGVLFLGQVCAHCCRLSFVSTMGSV